ncbi:hypothetical protein AAG906_020922 [Vitis piasezkii]
MDLNSKINACLTASASAMVYGMNIIKKCGINLIFAGDQHNHKPMLEHPQNSGDNGSALQHTNGNVHGANQDDEHYHIPTLDLLGNFGDNGSVVLEDTDTNGNVHGANRDDEHYHIPLVIEDTDSSGNVHGANQDDEHYHIPTLDLLGNFGDNGSVVLEDANGNRKRRRDDSLPDVVVEDWKHPTRYSMDMVE